jgi:hypothetical protein
MQEERPPRAETVSGQPTPLSYATPSPKSAEGESFDAILHFFRRAVFSLGVGLFVYGGANVWMRYEMKDAADFMGWGAALVAITAPWGWRRAPRF